MFLCPWQDELPLPDSAETEPELVDVSVQSNVVLGCMAIPVIFIQLSAGLHRWVEAWGFLGALHAGRHRAWSFQGPSSRSALAALMESVLWLQLKTFPRFFTSFSMTDGIWCLVIVIVLALKPDWLDPLTLKCTLQHKFIALRLPSLNIFLKWNLHILPPAVMLIN